MSLLDGFKNIKNSLKYELMNKDIIEDAEKPLFSQLKEKKDFVADNMKNQAQFELQSRDIMDTETSEIVLNVADKAVKAAKIANGIYGVKK